MFSRTARIVFTTALALSGIAWAATPTAPATTVVGSLHVQVYGDHGRPVILIPGLAGGPWVWQATVDQLKSDHVVYALTLAGFDGTADDAGDKPFDRADASLLQLIQDKRLKQPVLVGHSLGATLALRFAGEHANLLGGVVAVDGLPVFPGFEAMDASQRAAASAKTAAYMAGATPAMFVTRQHEFMAHIGVIDPAMAEKYAAYNVRSSQAAVARYLAQDVGGDWRDGLAHVNVPVLEITGYYAPDSSSGPRAMTQEQKVAYYRSLLANAPKLNVVALAPSRHYVMLDAPEAFARTLAQFLASL